MHRGGERSAWGDEGDCRSGLLVPMSPARTKEDSLRNAMGGRGTLSFD